MRLMKADFGKKVYETEYDGVAIKIRPPKNGSRHSKLFWGQWWDANAGQWRTAKGKYYTIDDAVDAACAAIRKYRNRQNDTNSTPQQIEYAEEQILEEKMLEVLYDFDAGFNNVEDIITDAERFEGVDTDTVTDYHARTWSKNSDEWLFY